MAVFTLFIALIASVVGNVIFTTEIQILKRRLKVAEWSRELLDAANNSSSHWQNRCYKAEAKLTRIVDLAQGDVK